MSMNMKFSITAYVLACKVRRADPKSVRVRFAKNKRVAFGILVHANERVLKEFGWVTGTQGLFAQVTALDCILSGLEEAESDATLKLVVRTPALRRSLQNMLDRKVRKDRGLPVDPLKEDEELWESVAMRWSMANGKIPSSLSAQDEETLNSIDNEVRQMFFADPSPLESVAAHSPVVNFGL